MTETKIKLLIVDDLEDNRLVLKTICKKIAGLELLEATDGLEATKVVERQRPQIVLMDVMMPVMDGFEATRRIKKVFPDTFVVVVTAVSDSETEAKFISIGADGYIRKPVDRESLRFKVENIISTIQIRDGAKSVLGSKKSITPFTADIRSMKTIFEVSNEEEMMNLGMWLTDFYTQFNSAVSMMFDTTLDFMYKMMSKFIESKADMTVIAEQDFDCVYISFVLANKVTMCDTCEKYIKMLGGNIILRDGFVYLKIDMKDVQKIVAPQPTAPKEQPKIEVAKQEPQQKEQLQIDGEEMSMLRYSHVDKISAAEYVASLGGDAIEEMEDMAEIEERWREILLELEEGGEKQLLDLLADTVVLRYAKAINVMLEFNALGYAMSSLATFLKTINKNELEEGKMRSLVTLLDHMLNDLSNWRHVIFIDKATQDIHYLDSSLFSSCMQIDAIISGKNISSDDDDDLEFF